MDEAAMRRVVRVYIYVKLALVLYESVRLGAHVRRSFLCAACTAWFTSSFHGRLIDIYAVDLLAFYGYNIQAYLAGSASFAVNLARTPVGLRRQPNGSVFIWRFLRSL